MTWSRGLLGLCLLATLAGGAVVLFPSSPAIPSFPAGTQVPPASGGIEGAGSVAEVGTLMASELSNDRVAPERRVSRGTRVRIGTDEYRAVWDEDLRTVFFPDGIVMTSGRWSSLGACGEHRSWHANGQLSSVEMWVDGEREGPASFHSAAGVLLAVGFYSRGFRTGRWTEYFEDGRIMSLGNYEVQRDADGRPYQQARTGLWLFLGASGEVDELRSGIYVDDQRVAPR